MRIKTNERNHQQSKKRGEIMSFQFTDREYIMKIVMYSPNWLFLERMLISFTFRRSDIGISKVYGLINDMKLDLFTDKVTLYSTSITYKELFDWFLKFLAKYEDLNLVEEDLKVLDDIYNSVRLKSKEK